MKINYTEKEKYIFTENYLQYHNFTSIKNCLDLDNPINILELGAYEGRSAIFMLENFCKHEDSNLTTVDWVKNPKKETLY